MNKEDEEVLVVKTEILFPNGVWQGFKEYSHGKIVELIEQNKNFLKRKFAETDINWQQIIPQIVLVVDKKIFIHRVPQSGSESRLHDMWPIFLGGHVNNFDGNIEEAIDREFKEEIDYKGNIKNKKFLGLVKLNEGEVNKVHTGLVWLFEGDSMDFEPTDDEGLVDGKFIDIAELPQYYNRMTYWSKEVAPYIVENYK